LPIIKHHINPKLGHIQAPDVEQADIAELHREMRATPYAANRTLAVLSKMFSLALVWKLRPDNLVKGVRRYPEAPAFLVAGRTRTSGAGARRPSVPDQR